MMKVTQTRLYLVRHGETEFNKTSRIQGRGIDAPLNKTGRSQAMALRTWFSEKKITACYASSLLRARQTAALLLNSAMEAIPAFSALDEMSYGVYEGLEFERIRTEITGLYTAWTNGDIARPITGGESPLEVIHRVKPCILEILQNHSGEHIVIVTHGRVLRIILAELLFNDLKRMKEIKHENASVNVLTYNGIDFTAEVLNFTGHLEPSRPI